MPVPTPPVRAGDTGSALCPVIPSGSEGSASRATAADHRGTVV